MAPAEADFYPRIPPTRPNASSRTRLWEAFGCLVVLVILAAILYPVHADESGSRRFLGLSNIKQAGLGALMYANDFDEALPNAHRWMDLTLPYTKNDSVFHASDLAQPSPEAYGNAFRTRLSRRNEDRIPEPKKTAMIFDSTLLFRNAASELWSLPDPPRHGDGTSNFVAFADGHAKSVNREASQNLR